MPLKCRKTPDRLSLPPSILHLPRHFLRLALVLGMLLSSWAPKPLSWLWMPNTEAWLKRAWNSCSMQPFWRREQQWDVVDWCWLWKNVKDLDRTRFGGSVPVAYFAEALRMWCLASRPRCHDNHLWVDVTRPMWLINNASAKGFAGSFNLQLLLYLNSGISGW